MTKSETQIDKIRERERLRGKRSKKDPTLILALKQKSLQQLEANWIIVNGQNPQADRKLVFGPTFSPHAPLALFYRRVLQFFHPVSKETREKDRLGTELEGASTLRAPQETLH